jgi:hypothetical protein
LLLARGVNPNHVTNINATPLHFACEGGHDCIITLLLASGADHKASDNKGFTHLHVACRHGQQLMVELLLESGADLLALTKDGRTALDIAFLHEALLAMFLGEQYLPLVKKSEKLCLSFCRGKHLTDSLATAIVKIIVRCPLIGRILVKGKRAALQGLPTLLQGIMVLPSVQSIELDFKFSPLFGSVQDILLRNRFVTSLRLSHCQIDDDAVKHLVLHWDPNSALATLFLPRNIIGSVGALTLVRAVAKSPAMRELDVSNNYVFENPNHLQRSGIDPGHYSIGYKGLGMIGLELPNLQHLTGINLSGCAKWIDYANEASEVALAQRRARNEAGQLLVEGVKRNRHIRHVNVEQNSFPESVEKEIAFYTYANNLGNYLISGDHGLADSVWCKILAKCCHCQKEYDQFFGASAIFYFLQKQPFLVQPSMLVGMCRKRSWSIAEVHDY